MQIVGIGRVIFWSGGSLWIGQALAPAELHSHHAIQIGIGLSDKVQFRMSGSEDWVDYSAAIILPDIPHMFQAPGKIVAHIFCAPESVQGRGLLARFENHQIIGLPPEELQPHATALRRAFDHENQDEELEHAALETVFSLSGRVLRSSVDARVLQAMAFIASKLAEPLTLEEVSKHVELSPGRFRHLFVAETGISFRAYLLWTRLNRALELGFGGASWTDAAHATNFSDSAHLSRTTRQMYGLAPSSLRHELPAASRPMTA